VQIVLCSPPDRHGNVHPSVLYAAKLCGINTIIKLGGVQAIAAMAYGTDSVPKCDKIFGPGNAWVTEAKQQVSAHAEGAAIDMPAGPSEVLVIADADANSDIVAADLLAQAEHGPDSQVLLLSDHAPLLAAVATALATQTAQLPRAEIVRQALAHSRLILVADITQALQISNHYAPEHLLLNVRHARQYLPQVRNAGSVFLGALTPESTGDYNAGTNHVLPTYGHARAYSGVSVASFVKQITVQTLSPSGLRKIGPEAVVFARAEGLEAHAQAVQKRLERLDCAPSVASASPLQERIQNHVLALARPEFVGFKGYSSARMEASAGAVFLNANESPWAPLADNHDALNRYPEPQPHALIALLAQHYQVATEMLLLGRGSDELIDLLTRAFCRAGQDKVLIMPPTFGMYKVCANVQAAEVLEVPLDSAQEFAPDWARATQALAQGVKLSYVCSPNNPTGGLAERAQLMAFIDAAAGRSLVVIDEAYIEFAEVPSAIALVQDYPHVVVLRTLSKAYGLAGARLGCAIANAELIALLKSIMAPYPVPTPVANLALKALRDQDAFAARIGRTKSARERLAQALKAQSGVRKVWLSSANFLTFKMDDARTVYRAMAAAGVVVRDVSHYPGLAQCLRVSVGKPEENAQFLAALNAALQALAAPVKV
jgi:histidinol-phosphate aminotransferase